MTREPRRAGSDSRWVRNAAAATFAVGAVGLAGALVEAHAFTLRRVTVPVLPAGARELRVLHLSDLHLTPEQRDKVAWVRALADEQPDLVVNTGDNLAHPSSLPVLLRALGPLLDVPGVFTLGSNDYYGPAMRNPFRYLLPDARRDDAHQSPPDLPGRELRAALIARGWADLANARTVLEIAGQRVSVVGTADAHMDLDQMPALDADGPGEVALHLGVTHAPYRRVLDGFRQDGCDLVLAGHTHGGQVCLPFVGALTTNCDLDTGRAKGLHGWPGPRPDVDPSSMWLHVSAGLGTNPYTPVRFFCRPEATLLTLTAR